MKRIDIPKLMLSGFLIMLMCAPSEIKGAENNAANHSKNAVTKSFSYVPEIHGALRTRFEHDFDNGGSRFQVRNARVTLNGYIAPSIDYFIQTDLCDRGKMKILDAWGRIAVAKGLKFQAGQFRLPFGTDAFRGPGNYVFSNRSFIGKDLCNVRGVGAKLSYTIPLSGYQQLSIEGGAFNPTSISDHEVWIKELSYAAKGIYTIGNVRLITGVQSISPDSIRVNLWNASCTWTTGRWTFEGEYMNKHYTHHAHKTAHGWLLWTDYAMPIKAGVFNRASFQARWDGMTAHSDGKRDDTGALWSTRPARQRVTAGATVTYAHKALHCDQRLDYEKYFYRSGAIVPPGEGDKICAEMVIRF